MSNEILDQMMADYGEETPKNEETEQERTPKQTRASSGGRLTKTDLELLIFLSSFPCSTLETLRLVTPKNATNLYENAPKQGELVGRSGLRKRMTKLYQLQVIQRAKHPISGKNLYGATPYGAQFAREAASGAIMLSQLDGQSKHFLSHNMQVANVAAQLASPAGMFRESLGIDPVPVSQLYPEPYIRKCFGTIKKRGGDWGEGRVKVIDEALELIQEGMLIQSPSDLWRQFPNLLTVSWPKTMRDENAKAYKYPDLACLAPTIDGEQVGMAIEVELSEKAFSDYLGIVSLYALEMRKSPMYSKLLYFTDKPAVEKLLRRADKSLGTRLFEQDKIAVMRLKNPSGKLVQSTRRLTAQTYQG